MATNEMIQAHKAKRNRARIEKQALASGVADALENSELRVTARAIARELMGVNDALNNTETLFLSIAERMPVMTTAHDTDEKYIKACRDAIKPLREQVFNVIAEQEGIDIPKRISKPTPAQKAEQDDFRKFKNGKLKMLDNARADIITVYAHGCEATATDRMLAGENPRTVFTQEAKLIRDALAGVGDLTDTECREMDAQLYDDLVFAYRVLARYTEQLDTLNLPSKDKATFLKHCKAEADEQGAMPRVAVKALDESTADVEEEEAA